MLGAWSFCLPFRRIHQLFHVGHFADGGRARQAAEIDGRLLINDGIDLLPKELPAFARVEVTEAHPYDLVGRVV